MTILKARKTPTILTEDTVIIPHKAKMFHAKVKTELSDFKESKPLLKPSEVETDSLDIQKSKLQVRFKELRDESLAVLLTDTLSILKLNKNEQRKSFRKEKK